MDLIKTATKEDISVLTLPIATRAFVLRIVMINRLINEDYAAATHILEKTTLDPGPFFKGLFERGPILGKHIYYKIGGIVYFLYKAALENEHKRAIRLLQDEGCLEHVRIYARSVFSDDTVRFHVLKNPYHKEQYDRYLNLAVEEENAILTDQGKAPITKEELLASHWKDFKDWIDECKAKKDGQKL